MSQVNQLKEECRREEGGYNMCKGMEDWLERKKKEGLELGRDEGARNKLREIIGKKLAKGKTAEEIADALEESVETVLEVIKEIKLV